MTRRGSIIMSSNKENKPKIMVTKDGPYIVYGKVPILEQVITVDEQGIPVKYVTRAQYSEREVCVLCRCGRTSNKPYCDGTHAKTGFIGTETAGNEIYLDQPEIIDDPTLKLNDIKELCASARFCHRADGIWNLIPKSNDPQAHKIACEETCDCPSGRLNVEDKKHKKIIEPDLQPSISLLEDPAVGVSGPIWVKGKIPIESASGRTYRIRNRVTLCRCGKSTNKPFCDSSHYPEEDLHQEAQPH